MAGYHHNKRDKLDDVYSVSLVTAAVDQMLIHKPDTVPDEGDLMLDAHVSWVGNSSMEVTETVSQNGLDILKAKFLIVARHSRKNRAVPVNPLVPETDEEKKEFEEGSRASQQRKHHAKSSLLNAPPDIEESHLIHDIFRSSIDVSQRTFKRLSKNSSEQWMTDAILKSSVLCFPEHRNLHNKIFGGFVMRKAFEHSWSNALIFSQNIVRPVFIDDVTFQRPVSIGDLFFLSSQVFK